MDDARRQQPDSGPAEADVVEAEREVLPLAEVLEVSVISGARDISAMADPENAHSPMSPDQQVSNEHTERHIDQHSTGGTTPVS